MGPPRAADLSGRDRGVVVGKVVPGDPLPVVTAYRMDGVPVAVPSGLSRDGDWWYVILFYRGHWCPMCRRQLRDFQTAYADLAARRIEVVAVSADSAERTEELIGAERLTYPVLHGADVESVAARLGAYVDLDRPSIEPLDLIVDDAGRVVYAMYSSGAIGRLIAADVQRYIAAVRPLSSNDEGIPRPDVGL